MSNRRRRAILKAMESIAVVTALLKAQLPDVTLRVGSTVLARVASRGEHHAVLVLGGMPVTAEVPDDVKAGSTLRLKVQAATEDRITLQIDQSVPLIAPQAPPTVPRETGRVTVQEQPARRRGEDGEPADIVALSFHSPALGRLDLRLELQGARLLADVQTPAGPSLDLATSASERLRANLAATGLDPTVRVSARRDPVDFYA
jgi:hypothetical protein